MLLTGTSDRQSVCAGMENRCFPTFKRLHPDKIMIPCMDNAPYHHNRGVPSLSTITTKTDMYKLMTEGASGSDADRFPGLPEGATIPLPVVPGKREATLNVPISEAMLARAHAKKPEIPTLEEMKSGFLAAVKQDSGLKHHLECKLETFIAAENKKIRPDIELCTDEKPTANSYGWRSFMLWTPPYSPKLQPIEEFWGVGKNYTASKYANKRTMRECVAQLQDGWYGNPAVVTRSGAPKGAVKCASLVRRAIEHANVTLKRVGGLTGEVGKGTVKLLPGVEIVPGEGDTDMFVPHVEVVDLTQDDDHEPDVLSLSAEDHHDHTLELVAQGDHELVLAEDDADLQLGLPSSGMAISAPSDSPAKRAQERHGRQ